MDSDPNAALKKLNFLLQNPPFPPETFRNLLLLYCRHQYYAMAADVMAENAHLTYTVRARTLRIQAHTYGHRHTPTHSLSLPPFHTHTPTHNALLTLPLPPRRSWTACSSTWTR